MNNETVYLMSMLAARHDIFYGSEKERRQAKIREKKRNLQRAIDTIKGAGRGRRRKTDGNGTAQKSSNTKDLIARSKTMRREIVNQGVMYLIIGLFVFLMMPLLHYVS